MVGVAFFGAVIIHHPQLLDVVWSSAAVVVVELWLWCSVISVVQLQLHLWWCNECSVV